MNTTQPQHPVRGLKPQLTTWSIKRLDEKRQERWTETVESIDFTHSNRKTQHTINRLTGRTVPKPDKCPVTANAIASQLFQNGRWKSRSRGMEGWQQRCGHVNPIYNRRTGGSAYVYEGRQSPRTRWYSPRVPFTCRRWCNQVAVSVYAYLFGKMKKPLNLSQGKLTVIALPKPNKPKDDNKSYRPTSLLCIPFKLPERMIHGRINPHHWFPAQLPHDLAGFR